MGSFDDDDPLGIVKGMVSALALYAIVAAVIWVIVW